MEYKRAFLFNYRGKIIPETEKWQKTRETAYPRTQFKIRGSGGGEQLLLSFPSDRIPENSGQHIIHRK